MEQTTGNSPGESHVAPRAMSHLRVRNTVLATTGAAASPLRAVTLVLLSASCWFALQPDSAIGTVIRFQTVVGTFDVRMFDAAMPRSVANFLNYVDADKFNGTVVHRNSDTSDPTLRDFVIQGGGYSFVDPVSPTGTMTYNNVATIAPIADEPGGGVAGPSNVRGTIAMAKSGPNTATSQWFINQGNNSFLDSPARSDGGFSAFGRVLGNGMTVVDAIGDLPLPPDFGFSIGQPFNDLPLRNFSGSALNQIRVQNTVTVSDVRVLNIPAGDYNFDGSVNMADYQVWKADFGSTTKAEADGNGNGRVDAADYAIWRNTFGQMSVPGGGAVELGALPVPEPTAALLAAIGALPWFLLTSRRRAAN